MSHSFSKHMGWLVLIALLHAPALIAAQEPIRDANGHLWHLRWHGVNAGSPRALSNDSAPFRVVAGAVSSAQAKDWARFASFLSSADSNSIAQARVLYDTWATNVGHTYLIAEEARSSNVLQGVSGTAAAAWAALSVVPVPEYSPTRPVSSAQVVFVRGDAGRWSLATHIVDASVARALSNRARIVPVNGRFSDADVISPELSELQKLTLSQMRKNGASAARLLSEKENFQRLNRGVQMYKWSHWVEYYGARLPDPPIRFDLHDPFPPDFTTPENACRSYLRLLMIADRKTLFKNANETGRERLREFIKDDDVNRVTYHTFGTNRLTRITLFLTASTILEGREYVLVCWRAEDALDPAKDIVLLQTTFFVRRDEKYLFTEDVRHSGLSWLFGLAGLKVSGLWKYPDYISALQASELPPSFYSFSPIPSAPAGLEF